MGIAVFAGMLGVTVFGLFLTPVFYVVDRAGSSSGSRAAAPARSRGRAAAACGGTMIVRLVIA